MRRTFHELSPEEQIERLEGLARKALGVYGLEDARLRHITPATNVLFEVTAGPGRHYVLRICESGRDEASLQREMLWLTSLRRFTNLGVPEPIIMQTGAFIRTVSLEGVPGRRPCMLFQWVTGKAVGVKRTPDHLWRIGRFIGQLHEHGARFRWPDEWSPSPWQPPPLVSMISSELESLGIDPGLIAGYQVSLERLAEDPDAVGVIHGALRTDHLLFHDDEVRAIDFETCQVAPFALDLQTVCASLKGRDNEAAFRDALFAGYASVRPGTLPDDRVFLLLDVADQLATTSEALNMLHQTPSDAAHKRFERDLGRLRDQLAQLD